MAHTSKKGPAGKHLHDRDFSGNYLEDSDFAEHTIADCDFSGADLSGCDFAGAKVDNCDFIGAELSECDFTGAILDNCDFTGASLDRCVFTEVTWNECDFTGANTSNCVDLEFEDDDNEDRGTFGVSGGSIGGISITGGAAFISTHTNSKTGYVADLGWIRLESPPNHGILGPSVSIFGQTDSLFDVRTVDFTFAQFVLRAESIGGGKIRLSMRDEESALTGEVQETILEARQQMRFNFGTVYNLMS